LLAKVDLSLGLFDDAIAAASAVINNGTYKLMTGRFGVDANVSTKNVTWDLHRPDNKYAAANTEVLYIVTDRLGNAGAFASGIQTMRQAARSASLRRPRPYCVVRSTGRDGLRGRDPTSTKSRPEPSG